MKKFEVGLGFRREIATKMIEWDRDVLSFIELAPENWMGMGGHWRQVLDQAAQRYPITCHGLSLSIGGPDPLNHDFINRIKFFLDEYNIDTYSEHLSYSQCDNAHLYDLLPIPFTREAIDHIVPRIVEVQDILKRPLILENVSYYAQVEAEMNEHEFISEIVRQSGCKMLLDVNNVYVNAFNHQYDPREFIDALPLNQVDYIHIAGHEKVSAELIIDTHGSPIIDPVFELLEYTLPKISPCRILLERDFNIPSLPELQEEINLIRQIINRSSDGK